MKSSVPTPLIAFVAFLAGLAVGVGSAFAGPVEQDTCPDKAGIEGTR